MKKITIQKCKLDDAYYILKIYNETVSNGLSGTKTKIQLNDHIKWLKKKLLSKNELLLIKKHYVSLNLPMHIDRIFKKKEINNIVYYMKKDKKNLDKKINLILLKKIGKTTKPAEFKLSSKKITDFLSTYYL